MARNKDFTDRLVVFLAKRDGIDKLVKTFQYVAKISNWYMLRKGNGEIAARFKHWEVSCGLSRKCFRTGRFLTGFNTVRTTTYPNWTSLLLAIIGNSGEMVYFFFDHFTWLSKIGLLDSHVASKSAYISAFGESVSYIAFILTALINLKKEWIAENRHINELNALSLGQSSSQEDKMKSSSTPNSSVLAVTHEQRVQEIKAAIAAIRFQRILRVFTIAANISDLIIDLADLEPNPFVTHAITLGISGLTSAWSGWFQNWPRDLV